MTNDSLKPRIHTCATPMTATRFPHNHPNPQYRSQPTWSCHPCKAWEPREGWVGPLPAGWDGQKWADQ